MQQELAPGLELLEQAVRLHMTTQGVAPGRYALRPLHQLEQPDPVVVAAQQLELLVQGPLAQPGLVDPALEGPELVGRDHQQAGTEMQLLVEVELQPGLDLGIAQPAADGGAPGRRESRRQFSQFFE